MRHGDTCEWPEMPNIDWPPDHPTPTVEEIVAAAMDVSGYRVAPDKRVVLAVYRATAAPWLMTLARQSGIETGRTLGTDRPLKRCDSWFKIAVSPAGQAIAHAMNKRLREIIAKRKETS